LDATDKIKILIVEDELIIAEDIRMKLESLGYDVIGVACDSREAENLIQSGPPDIVLLDIMVRGEADGLYLGGLLRNRYHIPFIFLTSYADKVTIGQAKLLKPDGYLVKPFTDKDLFTSIEIAFFKTTTSGSDMNANTQEPANTVLKDCIFIKKDYMLVKVRFEDLRWIKSEGNYLELYCVDKKYLTRSTLKDFMDKLPKEIFVQVHKSYAVNLHCINAIEHTSVVIDGQRIPVGRLFTDHLKRLLQIEF
jgi:two-component system, LytTR family, response regulator LytT